MLKNSGSKHSNSKESHSNSSSGIFQNLKRLANSNATNSNTGSPTYASQQQHSPVGNEVSTSPASSSSFRKLNAPSRSTSTEARPLNKKSTLNTQNLSQYMNGKLSGDVPVSSQHARSHSMQSKYSYSKRNSSQASNKLTRQHTGQSHSASSLLSQGSLTNLSKFTTPDGKIYLEMPSDPYEVEVLFEDIMYKRNIFQSLSEDKQEALMGYSIEKKWLIVKQDLQNELKKMRANTTSSSTASRTSMASDHHPILTANSSLSSPKSVLMTSASSPTSTVYSNSLNHSTTLSSVGTSTSKGKKLVSGSLKKQPSLNNIYRGGAENNTSASTLPGDRTNRPPIHYVQRILADKLTSDEMKDLWVTLRTEQLDWVDAFIDHQGHIAMANVLMNSIYKTAPRENLTKELLEKENSFFKCFRVLSMLSQGLYEFSTHRLMTDTVAEGLFSTKLATRKMATEIFVCMLEKKNKSRFEAVLTSLDKKFRIGQNLHMIQNFKKMPQYFSHLTLESHLKIIQAWLFAVEQTLDGRGKMGSLVGASDEFKNGGGENAILEYCQWTMVFINHLCSCSDNINQRMLLRTKLENCGILRIMNKIKLLDYDKVIDQIELYDNNKLDDFNVKLEANNKAFNVDLHDPLSLLKNLWDICKGTENEKLLVSLVQHLFLSSSKLIEENQNSSKLTKQLKLMDSLVTNVSVASTSDEETNMNMAIQRLYDAMQTDEVARRAILESRALTKKLEEIQAERDSLSEKLSKAEHGLVGQLEDELHERDRILAKNQRVMQQLEAELEELKKKHLLEKHQQEVELRKMLTILNSRPEESFNKNEGTRGMNSSLNSSEKANIQKVLQDGLSRAKKDYKDDSKKFGMTLQPNKRLKMLRMQMENIENEARQLEMTNFAEFEKDRLEPPIHIKKPKVKKMKNKDRKPLVKPQEADVNKLNDLRRALAEIQMESNDISKFNVEERVNELFNEKKSLALKRLKELETKYKGFGIDFNVDEIMDSPKKNTGDVETEEDANYASLDPKTYQKKLDEINRITDQLLDIQTQTEHEIQVEEDGESDLSSSSSDDESEEIYQDASPTQELRSEHSELSSGSGPGSFLDALSQKYGTGQNVTASAAFRREQ
ncbi:ADM_collapsed_G0045770.mRNA.1.CDS.1 [Saccharomyces cerevisiae]|nr:ADM_collapsed_G0045770.mRNA.1.CDS.1 [Saccharomyces cerevisiae]